MPQLIEMKDVRILTAAKVARHKAACGAICPFCGHSDIEGRSIDVEGGSMYQRMWCPDCEAEWTDCYCLEGVLMVDDRFPFGVAWSDGKTVV